MQSNRDELKERLKMLLIDGLKLEDKTPQDIDDSAPIFVDGLGLDSIDALELVVLIEEHFHVTITDEEVGQVAFASVDALTDFIVANQNPSASPQP
jgi:acyl carrier protein